MESSRPVAFFALDVASPPPLIVPLSATDIIVPRMTTAWSSEPLPRDLQLLANTLRRIKAARFKPYLADVPHSRSSSPSSASSHSPSPSPPPQRSRQGQRATDTCATIASTQRPTSGPRGLRIATQKQEEEEEKKTRKNCRMTKRIGSLGLKQLGVELNWSDDTYEHIVKHAEKIFPKYLQNDVCWKTQAVKISFQKRAQRHGKHLNMRQVATELLLILREFAEPLGNYVDHWPLAQIAQRLCKKKAEKVRTEAVKRTATVVQEAVAPRPAPRVITVKKKAGGTQGPPTASLPPRRMVWIHFVAFMPPITLLTARIVMRKGGTYVHNHYRSGEDMGETLIDTALQNTSSIFSAGPSVSSRCQTQQDGLAVNGITPGPNAASLADYQKTGISCMEKAVNVVFCGVRFRIYVLSTVSLTVSTIEPGAKGTRMVDNENLTMTTSATIWVKVPGLTDATTNDSTLFHLSRFRGGTTGAYWAKWAIQRGTWRGKLALKRNQPVSTLKRPSPSSLTSNSYTGFPTLNSPFFPTQAQLSTNFPTASSPTTNGSANSSQYQLPPPGESRGFDHHRSFTLSGGGGNAYPSSHNNSRHSTATGLPHALPPVTSLSNSQFFHHSGSPGLHACINNGTLIMSIDWPFDIDI
ncbi:hypothetical protein IW262DRAFT_1521895 [Armillaria fumosa]|nr:hypothetical protein IW262DRAFT_1521895 [Armillaria fumosa]